MTLRGLSMFALGAVGGALWAHALARAARGRRGGAIGRVLLAALLFVPAARAHALGAAAGGWLAGAIACGAWCYRRLS